MIIIRKFLLSLFRIGSRGRRVVPVAMATGMLVTGCGMFGETLEEPPSGFNTQSTGQELPRVPVPEAIPGLTASTQSDAEDTIVGGTPQELAQPVQSNQILGGVPITRDSITDPRHPLAKRMVFFDFNSSKLTPDSLDLIRGHAEYLSRFSDVRVRIEGHTDERGSREYNIALGDNRAKSVSRIMQLQGVDSAQFSTLSYGEEVPIDEAQSERAYRKNRRVEVVYEGYN